VSGSYNNVAAEGPAPGMRSSLGSKSAACARFPRRRDAMLNLDAEQGSVDLLQSARAMV
jgi:hypothetical protein